MADAPFRHAFVVPAYGDSPYLDACIASIVGQSLAGSSVVVTTSTPSSHIEFIAGRHRVPLEINPRRGTIGMDWNFALGASNADYVTIAHQDDSYRSDYLERMAGALLAARDALIGFSDFVESSDQGPRPLHANIRIKRFLTRRAFGRNAAIGDAASKRKLLAWGNPVCCPSVVFNRSAVGDFRFPEDLHSNLDWEAWRQLALRPGEFVYVREPLVTRHIHAQSETSALIADHRRLDEDRAMFERFWPAPVAALIMLLYRASYRANRT